MLSLVVVSPWTIAASSLSPSFWQEWPGSGMADSSAPSGVAFVIEVICEGSTLVGNTVSLFSVTSEVATIVTLGDCTSLVVGDFSSSTPGFPSWVLQISESVSIGTDSFDPSASRPLAAAADWSGETCACSAALPDCW